MKLKDKVAIVTGGGSGLGREIVLAYAEEGADLVLAARTQSRLEAVAEEVRALGRKALAISTDVTVEEQVNRMAQKTVDEFGKIDILVNNAGGARPETYIVMTCDLSLADWEFILKHNLTGDFLCSKAVLKYMMPRKSGTIINMSSGMGLRGRAAKGAYCAAKFAVEGLTQAMARELAPFNIRVNTIGPGGRTATGSMLKRRPDQPLHTMLPPEIIRPVAVYLASDDSIGVTGQAFRATTFNHDQDDLRELFERRNKAFPAP